MTISRRGVLTGAAAAGAVAAGAGLTVRPALATGNSTTAPARTVLPGDARYPDLVVGNNQRFVAAPDAVCLPTSTQQVLDAVQKAVSAGKRISVRSGGHCYADFVYHQASKVILDLSAMVGIAYDQNRNAFAVQPGAILGEVYEVLKKGWNVTLPGGVCPTVGIGGHATGGGYGLLSRRYGVVADHIEAVEMVVVDKPGTARVVVASRNASDPNNDLWWATAGGGGGNFGIVTKYWFRSPGASGTAPEQQLPQPPGEVLVSSVPVGWPALDQNAFSTLVRNFGTFFEQNCAANSPYTALSGVAFLTHRSAGGFGLVTQIDAGVPDAARLLDDYVAAVLRGTGIVAPFPPRRLRWLAATRLIGTSNPATMLDPTMRSTVKSAYMRRGFNETQIAALWRNLTRTDYANPNATVQLTGVAGGKVNTVAEDAIAYPHRSAAFLALFENFWMNPAEDQTHIGWLRSVYGETFAATGGYPVPNDQTDGCYINSPDMDIRDPNVNKSGVPWSKLYYKNNYPRLQRVKAHWDPSNVFRHSQSIELP
ncbi:FAD-binding oxidoreductase [Krasilnikovia sp. MM14-A1259]|uniref:FAD-binding oxidoreductase n=1 Tax=Krasilnikovia sp. MM14-A1259 TaxID=3373539 RepID=UPI0037F38AC9